MNTHVLLAIFNCVENTTTTAILSATFPSTIEDSSCMLSNGGDHNMEVQQQNSTSPSFTTPPTRKSRDRSESLEDIEVFTRKIRLYEKGPNGRRGNMGTPIRPDGPGGGPPNRVPPPPTTVKGSGTDINLPGGSTMKTVDPKYRTIVTTKRRRTRTPPFRENFAESCEYLAHYCLRAYNTGVLCARTLYYTYYTYKNFCMMDYVNCMERHEIWQIIHMGPCFNITELTDYLHYPIENDDFLDQDTIKETM